MKFYGIPIHRTYLQQTSTNFKTVTLKIAYALADYWQKSIDAILIKYRLSYE